MNREYFILKQGQKLGPFTDEELMDRPLEPDDMVLSPDETDFRPAHSLSEFDDYFKSEGIYYPTIENTRGYRLRLPAFIIDLIIIIFGTSIFGAIFFGKYMAQLEAIFPINALGDQAKMHAIFEHHYNELLVVQIAFILVTFIYHSLCESSRMRGSVGKYIFGLAVVDELGYSLSFGQAAGRNLGKLTYELLSFVIGFLAYLLLISIPFTLTHQALHDKMANCFVVKKNA
ncbi:RDD family protein [Mucilaginibacter sp. AW1-3]